ncbi:MAG: glycosyltransferase family 2 protein [Nitrospiraceae bacterium]|nr:glycosyltransferase family 2 protein [Nitrospiraceae bacterium]
MHISVIIPTLDEERTILDTLARTASLGFDELIVVDGGSTDGTHALVESYRLNTQASALSPIQWVTAPSGRARQMNEGAKASGGEILLFLHADTQLPNDAKKIVETTLADRRMVGGRFDVRFDRPSGWGTIISTMMNWRSRLSGIATGDQALFVRRHIFEQIGGFADMPLMEDIELSRRLKRRGTIAAPTATVTTSFRRWEQHGPLQTILLMWTLRFLYWIGIHPRTLSRWYGLVR